MLSPLIIEAYSLSQRTAYHLDDKSCPRSIPEVFTPVPAAQEKPIEIFIIGKYNVNDVSRWLYQKKMAKQY